MNELQPHELPIRAALARERERAWERLGSPGTWFDGATRIAMANESRRARSCALCETRAEALSPYAVSEAHADTAALALVVIEAVHRLSTDAGRITESWVKSLFEQGLREEEYVEIIGIVAVITALDTFDWSLGLGLRELPIPQPGDPDRQRPVGARTDIAWVATMDPNDMAAGDLDPFSVHGDKNIHRTVSLVPQEVFNFFDLDVELYLKDHEIRDFDTEYRALSHAQIELMAGRASALNNCFY